MLCLPIFPCIVFLYDISFNSWVFLQQVLFRPVHLFSYSRASFRSIWFILFIDHQPNKLLKKIFFYITYPQKHFILVFILHYFIKCQKLYLYRWICFRFISSTVPNVHADRSIKWMHYIEYIKYYIQISIGCIYKIKMYYCELAQKVIIWISSFYFFNSVLHYPAQKSYDTEFKFCFLNLLQVITSEWFMKQNKRL